MDAQNGNIGAMYRTAHVEAAGDGNPQLRGKIFLRKAVAERIHHALHQTGGIGRRRMTMHPALRVHNVADRVMCPRPGTPIDSTPP